jgi:hypothetical protein
MLSDLIGPSQLHRCFPQAGVGKNRRAPALHGPRYDGFLEVEQPGGQPARIEPNWPMKSQLAGDKFLIGNGAFATGG